MSKVEQFSNRWGIILASLGMAIGAGNIWRFPRLAGQYGGTFIVLWILFLLVWSIPLLLAEFAIGKHFKKGVIGSFASLTGERFTWMGFFIAACTLGIAFYYSIVTSWSLQYLGISITNALDPYFLEPSLAEKIASNPNYLDVQWDEVANGNGLTVMIFVAVVVIGTYLLVKGVRRGLERANRVLIPTLFILLAFIAFIAINMENGLKGLEYMFSIDPKLFAEPKVWIEALSQSAWSTGAGWGLMMTISSYSRTKEDVTLNTFVGAFGNNTASLLAGMAILPAVFALSATHTEALDYLQAGNQALTFTIIPKLFAYIPGGAFLSILFFLALFLAAFSSLLPMIEMFTKNIYDMGITRKKSVSRVIFFFIIFGLPSALSLDFFSNQDWVWGVGLIVTGMFIMIAVVKYGAKEFKTKFIDSDSDFKVPTKYFTISITINIGVALFLIYWWLSQGYSEYPWFDERGLWNVFDTYSNASVITQWLLVLVLGISINKYLYRKFVIEEHEWL